MPAIVRYPHSALTTVCDPITNFKEACQIAGQAHEALRRSPRPGVGLAANQVGWTKQLFVLDTSYLRLKCSSVFLNPLMLSRSNEEEVDEEGCLSLPASVKVKVARPVSCTITAMDLWGIEFSVDLTGLAARAALHEMDHLAGKTLMDLGTKAEKRRAFQEIAKAIKRR